MVVDVRVEASFGMLHGPGLVMRLLNHMSGLRDFSVFEDLLEDAHVCVVFKIHSDLYFKILLFIGIAIKASIVR